MPASVSFHPPLPGPPTTVRQWRRRKSHFGAIVAMLALGIAGSTAVFSFLYQVLFQPTGIADPARVVEVYQTTPPRMEKLGVSVLGGLPFAGMIEQRARNRAFSSIAMAYGDHLGLAIAGQEPRRVRVDFVSAGYFETLGVRLRAGRTFTRGQELAAEPDIVISDRLWTRALDRDAAVMGRELLVHGRRCRVVGIAPPGFAGHQLAERVDVWLPWGALSTLGLRVPASGVAIARVSDGFSVAQAASVTAGVGDRYLAGLSPEEREAVGQHRARPLDLDRSALLESLLPKPWLLLAAPMLMLLLACANVANLQLAEIEVRKREFASRAALGASPRRILGQVLGETLAPGVAACALGLALAYPCMTLLQRVPTQRMQEPRLDVALDPVAAAFAVGLALLSIVLVGILPAVRASRSNLADALKAGGGAVVPAGRWRDVLLAVQAALALMLMTSGVLVTRSLDAARNQDLGLRPEGVVGIRLHFGGGDDGANAGKVQRLLDGARALPGVRAAAVSPGFPLENVAAGGIATGGGALMGPLVGANHFATLGVRVVAGREYAPEDLTPGARVVVINEAAAKKYFAGGDAVGRMLGKHQAIGVVADHAAMTGIGMHVPMAFIKPPVQAAGWACLLVRTDGRPRALLSSLRQLARRVDPTAPVLRVATLRDHLDGLNHHLQVASWLLGLCGLASLALAAMGVHSLLACRVARQRREIGLRVALGARPGAVVRLVVWRLAVGVAVGAAAGAAGGFYLSLAFRSLFAGAASLHAGALASSAVALVAVALLASAAPSWKALRVDPSTVLRGE